MLHVIVKYQYMIKLDVLCGFIWMKLIKMRKH